MAAKDRPKPYIILVGVDYSEIGDQALDRAFELASQQPNGEVHVINVATAYGPMVSVEFGADVRTLSLDEAAKELSRHVEEKVKQFSERRQQAGLPVFGRACTHVRLDTPADGIAQLASDLEADLVVVGTHGRRGLRRLLLGSVAEGVVRLAPTPVLVVRPRQSAAPVPQIEPPCPACMETRKRTGGEELWCERHRERHDARHSYHDVSRNAEAQQNMPPISRTER